MTLQELINMHFSGVEFTESTKSCAEQKIATSGIDSAREYLQVKLIMNIDHSGKVFIKQAWNGAYRRLRNGGEGAVREYLKDPKLAIENFISNEFCPPVECNVVAVSRPFSEWTISIVSANVQRFLFELTRDKVVAFKERFVGAGLSKERFKEFVQETGVDLCGYEVGHIQELNKVFSNAINVYFGVEVKVNNKNNELQLELQRENEYRASKNRSLKEAKDPVIAYDEFGKLLQSPGVNTTLYLCQSNKLRPYNGEFTILPEHVILDSRDRRGRTREQKSLQVLTQLREQYAACYNVYRRDPDAIIRPQVPSSRRPLVPIHQWKNLKGGNKHSRMRLIGRADKAALSVLASVQSGDDWALIDLRGLLRNAQWRNRIGKGVYAGKMGKIQELPTVNRLLALVGDPTIHPLSNRCLFQYSKGVFGEFGIRSRGKGNPYKAGPKFVKKWITAKKVSILAVDLGVTHPVAGKVFHVDHGVKREVANIKIDSDVLKELKSFGKKWDDVRKECYETGLQRLPVEDRDKVQERDAYAADVAKTRVCAHLGLLTKDCLIHWDKMSAKTSYLSDAFINAGGVEFAVTFWQKPNSRSGIAVGVRRSDYGWSRECKPKLSDELNKRLWDNVHIVQRESEEYQRLTKFRKQLLRRVVNDVVRDGKRESCGRQLILALEDLTTTNGMFDSKGRRELGWDEFFKPKHSNPWYIKMLLTTFKELAKHRGELVVMVNPWGTSQRCPACYYVSGDNRDGENFVCQKCDYRGHADFDVATSNIAEIVITGRCVAKPKIAANRKRSKASG